MTLADYTWIGVALAYAGIIFGYVHERLKGHTENPVLDILSFPCMFAWAIPYGLYRLLAGGLRRTAHLFHFSDERTESLVRLWEILHGLLVLIGVPLLVWQTGWGLRLRLIVIAAFVPLAVYCILPADIWNWDPEGSHERPGPGPNA